VSYATRATHGRIAFEAHFQSVKTVAFIAYSLHCVKNLIVLIFENFMFYLKNFGEKFKLNEACNANI